MLSSGRSLINASPMKEFAEAASCATLSQLLSVNWAFNSLFTPSHRARSVRLICTGQKRNIFTHSLDPGAGNTMLRQLCDCLRPELCLLVCYSSALYQHTLKTKDQRLTNMFLQLETMEWIVEYREPYLSLLFIFLELKTNYMIGLSILLRSRTTNWTTTGQQRDSKLWRNSESVVVP